MPSCVEAMRADNFEDLICAVGVRHRDSAAVAGGLHTSIFETMGEKDEKEGSLERLQLFVEELKSSNNCEESSCEHAVEAIRVVVKNSGQGGVSMEVIELLVSALDASDSIQHSPAKVIFYEICIS